MNEPVAWMFQGAFDISTYVSFEKPNPDIYPNPTPLYTHPADESFDRNASHMAGEYVSYSENSNEQHWKEQAKIYKDELLKAYKLFNNMHKSATEAWESLDLSGQSDLEGARAWFFEGFAHGNTAQAKTLTDEEIAQAWAETKGDILHRLMPFARAILRKAQEK